MIDINEQIQAFGQELVAFAKTGPTSVTHAADMKRRFAGFIDANAASVESTIAAYRHSCESFLAHVVDAKGLPLVSVGSSGPTYKTANKAVSARFDELLPALRVLLEDCVASHSEQAVPFFVKQKTAFQRQLAEFIDGISAGGTRAAVTRSHVNPLKRALADVLEWGDDLNRIQACSFSSEVSDALEIANGAIAMSWHYALSSCLVPDHRGLEDQSFIVRDSWAIQKGLMHASAYEFVDDARKRRREVGCMCSSVFLFYLPSVPRDMLTPAGVASLGSRESA